MEKQNIENIGRLPSFAEKIKGIGEAEKYKLLMYLAAGLMWLATAYLLSSATMIFAVAPMGLALLCSQEQKLAFIYLGCVTSALLVGGDMRIVLLIGYTFVFAVRAYLAISSSPEVRRSWLRVLSMGKVDDATTPPMQPFTYSENLRVKIGLALATSLFLAMYITISSGFTVFSLTAALFMLASVTSFTIILSGRGIGAINTGTDIRKFHRECGEVALLFCLVFALTEISFLGFNFALTASAFICFFIARKSDMLRASVTGLACGLAIGVVYAPLFAIVGLVAGGGRKFSEKFMLPMGILAGGVYLFYLYGIAAMTGGMVDLMAGALIFLPVATFMDKRHAEMTESARQSLAAELLTQKKLYDVNEKELSTLSQSFGEMSKLFDSLSDTLRTPDTEQVDQICRRVCIDVCNGCTNFNLCYGRVKTNTFDRLIRAGVQHGHVKPADLPGLFLESCNKLGNITTKINGELAKLTKQQYREDKTTAFASGYASLSRLVADKQSSRREETSPIHPLGEAVCEILNSGQVVYESAAVFGSRFRRVVVCGVEKSLIARQFEALRSKLEEVLGGKLADPVIEGSNGYFTLTTQRISSLRAEFFTAGRMKEGEKMNGDTTHSFQCDGHFYAMLSDGMGSGRQAALVSRLCCAFAEKLTDCGGSLVSTVDTINHFMLTQNHECSSTIDILQLDTLTGSANFIKSGAAPSLVVRGGSVFKVSSNSMPIGLTREFNAEEITMPLQSGDVIVMFSDGVASDFESSLWLAKFVCAEQTAGTPFAEIADKILEKAAAESRRPDDMTVGIVAVQDMSK